MERKRPAVSAIPEQRECLGYLRHIFYLRKAARRRLNRVSFNGLGVLKLKVCSIRKNDDSVAFWVGSALQ